MKVLAFLIIFLFGGPSEETWTGKISDSQCAEHHEQGEGVEKMTDAQCTVACIRGGSKYVFVSEERVFLISNQDYPDLAKLPGIEVRLTGELKGDAITVGKIEKAP